MSTKQTPNEVEEVKDLEQVEEVQDLTEIEKVEDLAAAPEEVKEASPAFRSGGLRGISTPTMIHTHLDNFLAKIAGEIPVDANIRNSLEYWLNEIANVGFVTLQEVLSAIGAGGIVGGTLRQVLAQTHSVDFRNTNCIDLSTLTWTQTTFGSSMSWRAPKPSDAKAYGDSDAPNILSTVYSSQKIDSLYSDVKGVGIRSTGNEIYVNNGSTTEKPTGLLAYEKA